MVSCWLPTMVVQVRAQVRPCGICGGQSITGARFHLAFWFPLPPFHWLPHTHHGISSGAGTVGQIVAYVLNGLSLTSPKKMQKICYAATNLHFYTISSQCTLQNWLLRELDLIKKSHSSGTIYLLESILHWLIMQCHISTSAALVFVCRDSRVHYSSAIDTKVNNVFSIKVILWKISVSTTGCFLNILCWQVESRQSSVTFCYYVYCTNPVIMALLKYAWILWFEIRMSDVLRKAMSWFPVS
jgi:hypothetical protein